MLRQTGQAAAAHWSGPVHSRLYPVSPWSVIWPAGQSSCRLSPSSTVAGGEVITSPLLSRLLLRLLAARDVSQSLYSTQLAHSRTASMAIDN